jgi:transporter family-2 protein
LELVLVFVALVAGAGLPVQAGVNAVMARSAGRPEWAALVNFAVGLAALATWLAATRASPPAVSALARAPLWAWSGGLLGAFYVSAVVVLAPRLGVAATLGLSVAGQMAGALLLDHYGLLGLAVRPASCGKVLGAALLVAGVILIRR